MNRVTEKDLQYVVDRINRTMSSTAPPRVYDNDSLNKKLAAAKEWLKSREKK